MNKICVYNQLNGVVKNTPGVNMRSTGASTMNFLYFLPRSPPAFSQWHASRFKSQSAGRALCFNGDMSAGGIFCLLMTSGRGSQPQHRTGVRPQEIKWVRKMVQCQRSGCIWEKVPLEWMTALPSLSWRCLTPLLCVRINNKKCFARRCCERERDADDFIRGVCECISVGGGGASANGGPHIN